MDAEQKLVAVMRRDNQAPKRPARPVLIRDTNAAKREALNARAMGRRASKLIRARLRQIVADVRIGRHPSDVIDAIEDAIFIADKLHQTLGSQSHA